MSVPVAEPETETETTLQLLQPEARLAPLTIQPPTAAEIMDEIPVGEETLQRVWGHRQEIADIIQGNDPRMMVIVGPCGLSHLDETYAFAQEVAELQKQLPNIKFVLRLNTVKPRSSVGWKGILDQPGGPEGEHDLGIGASIVRSLYRDISSNLNLPITAEILDPNLQHYMSRDLMGMAWIGSRNAEDQNTRVMASGLPMPVGIKNPPNGDMSVVMGAIKAVSAEHQYLHVTPDNRVLRVASNGNQDTAVILRGANGEGNYDLDTVGVVSEGMQAQSRNPAVIVDCAHDNSKINGRKDPMQQLVVAQKVTEMIKTGADNHAIKALMFEHFTRYKHDIRRSLSSICFSGSTISRAK